MGSPQGHANVTQNISLARKLFSQAVPQRNEYISDQWIIGLELRIQIKIHHFGAIKKFDTILAE